MGLICRTQTPSGFVFEIQITLPWLALPTSPLYQGSHHVDKSVDLSEKSCINSAARLASNKCMYVLFQIPRLVTSPRQVLYRHINAPADTFFARILRRKPRDCLTSMLVTHTLKRILPRFYCPAAPVLQWLSADNPDIHTPAPLIGHRSRTPPPPAHITASNTRLGKNLAHVAGPPRYDPDTNRR